MPLSVSSFAGFFLASAILLVAGPVGADETSHHAMALKLLQVRKAEASLRPLHAEAKRVMKANMGAFEANEARRNITEKFMERLGDLLTVELGWKKLRDDYVQVYVDNFTEDELAQLIEFYRSPIGQKFVERTGPMLAASVKIAQKHFSRVLPQIHTLSIDMSKALKAAADGSDGAGG